MNRKHETGKSPVLLILVVVGVVLVGGVVLLIQDFGQADLDSADNKAGVQDTEIINTIDGGEISAQGNEEEEEDEQPAYLRTVNSDGSAMYIGAEPVDITLPGKGTIKAYKMAMPTNRKMKVYHKTAPRAKFADPHPAQMRKGNRQVEGKPEEVVNEGSDDETSESSEEKVGQSKEGSDK